MNALNCTGQTGVLLSKVCCAVTTSRHPVDVRGDTVDDAADEISGVGATGGVECPEVVIALLLQAGYAYVVHEAFELWRTLVKRPSCQ